MHDQILNSYYADNARKLHRTVDQILAKFGGLSNKDRDDFYSLANEVFVDVIARYDNSWSFDGFLYVCLVNKIKSEITKRNREKRKADRIAVSIDAPAWDEDGYALTELIASGYDLEAEIIEKADTMTYKLEKYLESLSKRQKEVLNLLSCCYEAAEIQKALHMTERQYRDELEVIRSYEKVRILL